MGDFDMRLLIAVLAILTFSVCGFADLPKFGAEANRIELAKVEIETLTKAVEAYKKLLGGFPAKLKDLQDAGIMEPGKPLKDPWGRDYAYDRKGPKNGAKKPDIWCTSPSKGIIGNWPEEKKKP